MGIKADDFRDKISAKINKTFVEESRISYLIKKVIE